MRTTYLKDGATLQTKTGGWHDPNGQMDCSSVAKWFRFDRGDWKKWEGHSATLLELELKAHTLSLEEASEYIRERNW